MGVRLGGVGLAGVPQADVVGVANGGMVPLAFPVPVWLVCESFIVLFILLVCSLIRVWNLLSFIIWTFSTALIISAWFTAPGVSFPGTNFLKLSSFDEPWCVSISVIFLNSLSCAVLFSDAVEIEDTKLVLTSLVVSRLLTRRFEFPVIIRATSLRISFLWSSLFWLTLVMVYSLYSLMKLQMVPKPSLFAPAKVGSGGGGVWRAVGGRWAR